MLSLHRSHVGLSTEQAALHSLALEKVDRGEKAQDIWSREVRLYAQSMLSLNRLVGLFGQGSIFSFLKAAVGHFAFMIKIKLGWAS